MHSTADNIRRRDCSNLQLSLLDLIVSRKCHKSQHQLLLCKFLLNQFTNQKKKKKKKTLFYIIYNLYKLKRCDMMNWPTLKSPSKDKIRNIPNRILMVKPNNIIEKIELERFCYSNKWNLQKKIHAYVY